MRVRLWGSNPLELFIELSNGLNSLMLLGCEPHWLGKFYLYLQEKEEHLEQLIVIGNGHVGPKFKSETIQLHPNTHGKDITQYVFSLGYGQLVGHIGLSFYFCYSTSFEEGKFWFWNQLYFA